MISNKIKGFLKSQTVMIIASFAAVISAFFVPPDEKYLQYIDFKVISLLFCLMAVVAGLMKMNMFAIISASVTKITSDMKKLSLIIINITFILSMFLTNDVSLIAVVPFTIGLFFNTEPKNLMKIIIIETAAANLGSMAMPFGNPQNLYLYSAFDMNPGEFISIVLPSVILSLFLINAASVLLIPGGAVEYNGVKDARITDKKRFVLYILLFILCILTVLRAVNYLICLAAVTLCIAVSDIRLIKKVDFGLLFTFAAFFIFVGNMTRIEFISDWISDIIGNNEFWCGLLLSQVISNVPAAIMLSGFTENVRGLLLGVDIGGLGTLVASLASIISYRYYAGTKNADSKKYMLGFLGLSAVFMVFLVGGVLITGNY